MSISGLKTQVSFAERVMTTWAVSVGDILDVRADSLICPANPQLNLSGGVGGEFLLRYGESMQRYLHDWLRRSGRLYVTPGTVIVAPACGSPFRVVLHAVAIDAFYNTSANLIEQVYATAFAEASRLNCHSIAAACLACGYGRAAPETFVSGIQRYLGGSIAGIERVEFRSTNVEVIDAVRKAMGPGLAHRLEVDT